MKGCYKWRQCCDLAGLQAGLGVSLWADRGAVARIAYLC